jgi:hypothetical protein
MGKLPSAKRLLVVKRIGSVKIPTSDSILCAGHDNSKGTHVDHDNGFDRVSC